MARKRSTPLDLSPFGKVTHRGDTTNGRWICTINYPAPIGIKKPSFRTVDEANEHLLSEYRHVIEGRMRRKSPVTVAVLAEDWYARRVRRGGLSKRTLAAYREWLDVRIIPYWGNVLVTQITPQDVQDWIDLLETEPHRTARKKGTDTPLSEGMVRRHRNLLDQICREGVRQGMIPTSPSAPDLVDVTDTDHEVYDGVQPVFTDDELQELYDVFDVRYRALIPLGAYGAGLRIGEWAGLATTDFDPRTRDLSFRRKVTDLGGRLELESWLKGSNPGRVIQLGEDMARVWIAHVARFSQNGWVFPAPKGGLLSAGNFRNRIWLPAVREIGRPDAKFHWLRHSNVSLLREEGVDLETVSKHVGHRSITTTERVYSHMTNARSAQVAEASDRLLSRMDLEVANTRDRARSGAEVEQIGGAESENAQSR